MPDAPRDRDLPPDLRRDLDRLQEQMQELSRRSTREDKESFWDQAGERLKAARDSEIVDDALDATKKLGGKALVAYDEAQDAFTQEDAWQATQETLAALKEVVRTQHAMILDLLDRVSRLEATVRSPAPGKS